MLLPTSTSSLPFLGPDVAADYNSARVVILPIPYEATTTYRRGCENGPEAILEASQQVEYYDDDRDCEIWPAGIYTHPAIADTRQERKVSSEDMLRETQETVSKFIADGKFVVCLGGEHSITTGIVEAYRQANLDQPFTVIQIDAHGDLRHEYEGSIHNHACVMRRIVDMGLPTVQIGIRSICREEANLIRERQLTVIRAREIAMEPDWMRRALAGIKTDKVFLTIDLDGIDPTLIPGVGTPEPGGLNWFALLTFLEQVFEKHQVIGCDVMELAPIVDSVVSEFTAAKLVYKLIGYQAFAKSWPLASSTLANSFENTGTEIGGYAPDFELPGTDGAVHHLARYLEQLQGVGVVFMGNHCPYVGLYLERLKQIQVDFEAQRFTLIGINSNDAEQFPDDSFDSMKEFAAENELNFPYLRDVTQDVAHGFGAQKTPHVFLLNREGVLYYNGQVDDNPEQPEAVQVEYFRTAIAQLLNQELVQPRSTEPIGCSIKWRP